MLTRRFLLMAVPAAPAALAASAQAASGSFATFISRLDAALVRFMVRMSIEDREELRAVMLANNEAVMKEVADRATVAKKVVGQGQLDPLPEVKTQDPIGG